MGCVRYTTIVLSAGPPRDVHRIMAAGDKITLGSVECCLFGLSSVASSRRVFTSLTELNVCCVIGKRLVLEVNDELLFYKQTFNSTFCTVHAAVACLSVCNIVTRLNCP
jgi:hypothetical protein